MGIHYDYKSTRGMKAMEKQAKREKKLAERKAKRQAKEGVKKKSDINMTSDNYGNSVGTSYYADQVTLHYFGATCHL